MKKQHVWGITAIHDGPVTFMGNIWPYESVPARFKGFTITHAFATRREAREHIAKHYGYIRTRKDLRSPPHNLRMPKAVRIKITAELVMPARIKITDEFS